MLTICSELVPSCADEFWWLTFARGGVDDEQALMLGGVEFGEFPEQPIPFTECWYIIESPAVAKRKTEREFVSTKEQSTEYLLSFFFCFSFLCNLFFFLVCFSFVSMPTDRQSYDASVKIIQWKSIRRHFNPTVERYILIFSIAKVFIYWNETLKFTLAFFDENRLRKMHDFDGKRHRKV